MGTLKNTSLALVTCSSLLTASGCHMVAVAPADLPTTASGEPLIDVGTPMESFRRVSTAIPANFAQTVHLSVFYKGNIHVHSLASDGDQLPSEVILWYRSHGYQFLSLTDHNVRVATAKYETLETPDFKLVPGEEISMLTPENNGIHVNGLCMTDGIGKLPRASKVELLSWAVSLLQVQPGAVFQLNHPNYFTGLEFQDLTPIPDGSLMEVANQKNSIAKTNLGYGPYPSTDVLWDRLLSRGRRIYGTASDDTHDLYRASRGSLPGRGWVNVAAATLSPPDICKALSEGRFYASNGVTLTSIDAEAGVLSLVIDPGTEDPATFTTEFIGFAGAVLSTETGIKPAYQLNGNESYVRARVTDANGKHAWVQPIFVQ